MSANEPVERTWVVRDARDEAPGVRSLYLQAVGERPRFIAGQYLTVRLPGYEPVEGKSYSISSAEDDAQVRLTVKEAGPFSRAILAKRPGDLLRTSAPYGFFYPERDAMSDLVFIAGGIGVTPAMGIIETLLNDGYAGSVTLFYSNKTEADIAFRARLESLAAMHERFTLRNNVTREHPRDPSYEVGRLSGSSIVRSLSGSPTAADYFVSGSIDFTRTLWKELRHEGVPQSSIYTEGFY
ncbi:MAG TPA: FAD-dependent oxidoreductase [Candidatus Paceibacterota bacterium]|nr:FAD-dependent oxidoreductase [Candidatus Paceibacterota bacterium]